MELFFDDTELEVDGLQFEGARLNYEGQRALSWQTLWYGPWLLDGLLDGAADVSEHLAVLLDEHQHRWQGWRIRTIIRHLLTVPVTVNSHARYTVARICVPSGWMRWWRLFLDQWLPKRKAGRPVMEVVDST